MTKLALGNSNVSNNDIRKIACIMKLSLFFLLLSMQVAANCYSQSVSFDVKNERLENELRIIERQTGYRFTYSNSVLPSDRPVTLHVREKDLNNVLDVLLYKV